MSEEKPKRKRTPGHMAAKKITVGKQKLRDAFVAASGKEISPDVVDDMFERVLQRLQEPYAEAVIADALDVELDRRAEPVDASDDEEEEDA